jgi:hypothetical protein
LGVLRPHNGEYFARDIPFKRIAEEGWTNLVRLHVALDKIPWFKAGQSVHLAVPSDSAPEPFNITIWRHGVVVHIMPGGLAIVHCHRDPRDNHPNRIIP